MKVCIIGGGFTGMVTAASLKRHCPDLKVIQIESDKEPKNLGFGESGPPQFLALLFKALNINQKDQADWVRNYLINSHSTIKYNLKWQGFLDRPDDGWYSGMPDLPDYRVIHNNGFGSFFFDNRIMRPDHNGYLISDLWYELYQQGRRSFKDVQGDINSNYWFCLNHTINSVDGEILNDVASVHINSFESCDWLRKEYGHLIDQVIVGTVQNIVKTERGGITNVQLDDGQTVDADFFIDCTGFKRIFARHFDLPFSPASTELQHNSVMVVANGYTDDIEQELQPYTQGIGMDYGWMFGIPLLNRKSYGYAYHSDFITPDQALEEMSTFSDAKTRMFDPLSLTWKVGGYKETWRENWCMVGLAAGFVDPFDANILALQFAQIFKLIEFFKNPTIENTVKKKYNNNSWALLESVAERVELHHALAPRNSSEYWRRNKDIAQRRDLHNKVFDVLNEYRHTPAAVTTGHFIAYPTHLYLSESLYYGLDMSRRSRQSSPAVLKLAEQYFESFNNLNRTRAENAITIKEWYQHHGIDLDQYIKFKK